MFHCWVLCIVKKYKFYLGQLLPCRSWAAKAHLCAILVMTVHRDAHYPKDFACSTTICPNSEAGLGVLLTRLFMCTPCWCVSWVLCQIFFLGMLHTTCHNSLSITAIKFVLSVMCRSYSLNVTPCHVTRQWLWYIICNTYCLHPKAKCHQPQSWVWARWHGWSLNLTWWLMRVSSASEWEDSIFHFLQDP